MTKLPLDGGGKEEEEEEGMENGKKGWRREEKGMSNACGLVLDGGEEVSSMGVAPLSMGEGGGGGRGEGEAAKGMGTRERERNGRECHVGSQV